VVPSKETMKETFAYTDEYFENVDDFIRDEKIIKWVEEDMHKLALELGKFERVKHFVLKRRPFTLESGEMTPTLKVKRKIVQQKYASEIQGMYVAIVD
jgi:long-chain acyl-CoA synthetase